MAAKDKDMAAKDFDSNAVVTDLKQAEDLVNDSLKACKKLRGSLSKARAVCAKPGWHRKTLQAVCESLRGAVQGSPAAELAAIADRLTAYQQRIGARFEHDFREQIRVASKEAGVEIGRSADRWTVGPFLLNIDLAKETAELEYAKNPFATKLPVDAAQIMILAQELGESLLAEGGDVKQLGDELAEATRVCVVRQGKRTNQANLRGELPAVFREMTFIRQARSDTLTRARFQEYPLARFVVEVARVVQSELNSKAQQHFRLEPAVLENAGNRKKSVFFPKDLARGFGEGTYYQAIVLVQ